MNKKTIISILLSVLTCIAFAQEATLSGGGDASGTGGSSSFSVGQTAYSTNTGTSGNSSAEGVQQPYEISVITAIENTDDIVVSFSVYPNPTSNNLVLNTGEYNLENLNFGLYDIQGKLLRKNEIVNSETQIEMQEYPAAVYLLSVFDDKKLVKQFRVVKQ